MSFQDMVFKLIPATMWLANILELLRDWVQIKLRLCKMEFSERCSQIIAQQISETKNFPWIPPDPSAKCRVFTRARAVLGHTGGHITCPFSRSGALLQ